jgi:predicted nucleotidyltransferase
MALDPQALVRLARHWPGRRLTWIGGAAIERICPARRQPTLDFAVALEETPEVIQAVMGRAADWRLTPGHRHRWLDPSGCPVDIIPAAAALIEAGGVTWPGEDRHMSLLGMRLAIAEGRAAPFPGAENVRIATIPALFLLKVVAWLDRPEREKDLGDIALLLDHHVGPDDDRAFEGEAAARGLYGEDGSAWLLGFDLGRLAARDEREALVRFCARAASLDHPLAARLARTAPPGWHRDEAEARRRVALFAAGLRIGGLHDDEP